MIGTPTQSFDKVADRYLFGRATGASGRKV
jgi:hypothetical protein